MLFRHVKLTGLAFAIVFFLSSIYLYRQFDVQEFQLYRINRDITSLSVTRVPDPDYQIKLTLLDFHGDEYHKIMRVYYTNRSNYPWTVINTVEGYKKGTVNSVDWGNFLQSGSMSKQTANHYIEPQIEKNMRENRTNELLQRKNTLERSKTIYELVATVLFFGSIISLFYFWKKNKEYFITCISLKSISLICNSALFLISLFAYIDNQGLVISFALTTCALSNAYLTVTISGSQEFSLWLTYTMNTSLLAVGGWLFYRNEGYYGEFIGIIVLFLGFINLYYRFQQKNRPPSQST